MQSIYPLIKISSILKIKMYLELKTQMRLELLPSLGCDTGVGHTTVLWSWVTQVQVQFQKSQKVGLAGSQVCSHLIRGLCTMDFVPGFDACTSTSCQGLLCTPPSYLILVTHMIRTSFLPVTHALYLQCTSIVLHLTPT